jgi:uncharacterized protein YdeI (YjbR/CyaY-like superfamily)
MAAPRSDAEIKEFKTAAAWERWLAKNYGKEDGIWLKFAKKASGLTTVTYPEALDVALCYGWIDGQTRGLDESYHLQRFTPRRARSKWSKINREKVAALAAAGRMQPPGLAEVERAKADGRWEAAYDPPSKIQPTPDLLAALDANPKAKTLFEQLTRTNRYAILYQVQDAKRPETRARRIEKFVSMLNEGKTPYPQALPKRG